MTRAFTMAGIFAAVTVAAVMAPLALQTAEPQESVQTLSSPHLKGRFE